MKQKKRFTFSILLSAVLLFGGCSIQKDSSNAKQSQQNESMAPSGVFYETTDLGQDYVNRFLFFGESTTYHMKSRGVLSEGTSTKQVWAPKSGTVCLDESIHTLRIIYPETGEELSLAEALAQKHPERILLTFGLNGVVRKYKKGADYYKSCYRNLIEIIRENSPNTDIFLGSCYPVASNMDISNYPTNAATINEYLNTLNEWCRDLATEEGLYFLNFAPLLKDDQGFLKSEYQVGDGIHLTREAYLVVLDYIRTHDGKSQ